MKVQRKIAPEPTPALVGSHGTVQTAHEQVNRIQSILEFRDLLEFNRNP